MSLLSDYKAYKERKSASRAANVSNNNVYDDTDKTDLQADYAHYDRSNASEAALDEATGTTMSSRGTVSYTDNKIAENGSESVQEAVLEGEPVDAQTTLTSESRPVTEEELAAGLTQENIDQGMSMASIGTVSAVTPSDLLTAFSIGGAIKGLISKLFGGVVTAATTKITGTAAAKGFWSTKNAATTASISKVSAAFGKSTKSVAKLVEDAALKKSIQEIVKDSTTGATAAKLIKKGIGVATGVAGTDVLISWYAMDNVIGGQKFFIGDLADGVRYGTIDPDEALSAVQESKETRETAITFVKASAKYNPTLWPFSKLLLSGVEADETAITFKESELNANIAALQSQA